MQRRDWDRLVSQLRRIIDVYDLMNRIMSLGLDKPARLRLVSRISVCRPRVVLESGCGPGTLAELIIDKLRPFYLIGVDPLPEMLEEAKRRLPGHIVDLVVAIGEHLPVRDAAVDATVAAFALRDYLDWRRGIEEMARVSRRCFAVLDIRRRRGLGLIAQLAWWGLIVPLAALIVTRRPKPYIALAKTILSWTPAEMIAREASRYARVEVEEFAAGFAFILYAQRNREPCSGDKRG